MSFNIRQLDRLSYDDAEPLLEEFIMGLINQFVESEAGRAHVKTHPVGGNWIGTFLEMSYLYGEMTPTKMTKGDVQQVMEYILPRKITLLDRSDTDDAIPELVAFWTFLKQEYNLRSAGAIVKYLKSIESKFGDWMFDPRRGGMAKNFMIQGMQAGHDMTTPEGVAAFQVEHNQHLKANPPSLIISMPAVPKDMQETAEELGIQMPQEGELVDPMAVLDRLADTLLEKVALLDEDGNEPDAGGKAGNADRNIPGRKKTIALPDPDQPLRELLRDRISSGLNGRGLPPLSAEAIALLKTQTITATEPGTILQDFQTMLAFIGSEGIAISNKRHLISLKLLPDLNQRLSHPVDIDLQRPQQKSYPPIHGLYLLLRATGIAKIAFKDNQPHLVLNQEVYDSWQNLNPTEQYCTLLEAWLIRAKSEMLGEECSSFLSEGDRCLATWFALAGKKQYSYKDRAEQGELVYAPGYHNLALMEMFGIVQITSGKPEAKKGWRVEKIAALLFGNALMSLVRNAYLKKDLKWDSATDASLPFNELQPTLQPYFPEWKRSLILP